MHVHTKPANEDAVFSALQRLALQPSPGNSAAHSVSSRSLLLWLVGKPYNNCRYSCVVSVLMMQSVQPVTAALMIHLGSQPAGRTCKIYSCMTVS